MRKLLISFLCLIHMSALADDIWETRKTLPLPSDIPSVVDSGNSNSSTIAVVYGRPVDLPKGIKLGLFVVGLSAVTMTFASAWKTHRHLIKFTH